MRNINDIRDKKCKLVIQGEKRNQTTTGCATDGAIYSDWQCGPMCVAEASEATLQVDWKTGAVASTTFPASMRSEFRSPVTM